MNQVQFFDTNILIDHLDHVKEQSFFYISSQTLLELESIKTNARKDTEVKHKARKATQWLSEHKSSYQIVTVTTDIVEQIKAFNVEDSNDSRIVMSARVMADNGKDIVFVTNDLSCHNIAESIFGLTTICMKNTAEPYKGYKELFLTGEETGQVFEDYRNGVNSQGLIENQYLILHDVEEQKTHERKYKGGKLIRLKELEKKGKKKDKDVITPKNALQKCAIDLLLDTSIPVKVIAGNYGSGKTWLTTQIGLHHVLTDVHSPYSKIMLLRNAVGSTKEVGFLKGTLEDKTREFFLPIVDSLDGGEEELAKLKERGTIEAAVTYFVKGRTFNKSFIIVDECEDLTLKELKLVGTRTGQDSAIVLCGDWKQAESEYQMDNGLFQFVMEKEKRPSSLVGIIVLEEDVRSSASKIFADLGL